MKMNIQDYIAPFLFKNKYCTLPGLGTISLMRESARYSEKNHSIAPPAYRISYNPVGSIDDAFPNFVANNENVSIAKVSNEVIRFCEEVKQEIAQRGEYPLEGLGKFKKQEGRLIFIQTEDINLGYVEQQFPVKEDSENKKAGQVREEVQKLAPDFKEIESAQASEKESTGSGLKYLLGLLLLLGLAAGVYFSYRYFSEKEGPVDYSTSAEQSENTSVGVEDTLGSSEQPSPEETPDSNRGIEKNGVSQPVSEGEYKVAVQSFADMNTAEARAKKLVSYGNKATTMSINEQNWLIIIASHPGNDTTALKDSLRRFYNPGGKPFIVK